MNILEDILSITFLLPITLQVMFIVMKLSESVICLKNIAGFLGVSGNFCQIVAVGPKFTSCL